MPPHIDRRRNIIALGNNGTGKTRVTLGLGIATCQMASPWALSRPLPSFMSSWRLGMKGACCRFRRDWPGQNSGRAGVIARFANSFDLKDWVLMESALAEELGADYSDLRGGPPKEITAHEDAKARREALEALDTQHTKGNPEITVAGKRASVEAGSMIFRSLDGLVFNAHARHHIRLSQDQDRGWAIDRIKQTVLWNEGDPNVPLSKTGERRHTRRGGNPSCNSQDTDIHGSSYFNTEESVLSTLLLRESVCISAPLLSR